MSTNADGVAQAPDDAELDQFEADLRTTGTPLVVKLLVVAAFVVILNETIMVNAMPSLMVDFDVSARTAQWISSIFMLTMAAVIPVTGWFLQRVPTRTAYTVAMGTFVVGTAIAGAAPTFEFLLVGRAVQAMGTAVMMPLLMTTIMTVVAEADRGRIMGNVTMAISVAPAMGPAISGLILQLGSWRLIFAFVLPVAVTIAVLGLRQLPNVGETKATPLSWISVILAAAGFGSLVYGLSEVGARSGSQLAILIGLGIALVTAFVGYQIRLQRDDRPLLDLRAFKSRTFAVGLTLMAVVFMGFLGTMILLPLYLQDLRGLSAMQTGLLVMPGGLAMGLLGPTVGRWYDRFGARPLITPGAIGMVAGLAGLSRVGVDTPYALILGLHVVLMLSLALIMTPSFTVTLGALTENLYSHGSSLLGTLQQVAGAMGTALLIVIVENRSAGLAESGTAPDEAFVGGVQWAFLVAAIFGAVVVALSLLIPSRPKPITHH